VCATLLLLTTASSSSVRPANYDAFGVVALTWLMAQGKTENVFISPTSIGIALAMAADGAAGPTRTAIVQGLRSDDSELALENAALIQALGTQPDATIGLADAIWLRQDLPPRLAYVNLLQSNYHAQVAALRFGDPSAAAAINAWTKAHTLGLIDKVVQKTSHLDFAYLTNALAFKGTWSSRFTKNRTHPAPFTDASGERHNVSMMSQTASFMTFDAPTYRALRLPYGKGGGCAAYVILPATTLEAAVQQLSGANFERLAHGLALGQVLVALPRFTAKYQASLKPVLKALGMGIAFDGADFSPMRAPPPRLFIADVNHASYVRVDEAGTTAAAATSVEVGFRGPGPLPPKSFIVDRPFVLGIRDEGAGTWLFIGVVRTLPPS